MRSRLAAVMLAMTVVAAACSGGTPAEPDHDLAPEDVDWISMTTANVFDAAGVDGYRQRRAMIIRGPQAEAAGLLGDFEVVSDLTDTPEQAMTMELTAAPALEQALLAANGGATAATVVGDRVWVRSGAGEWEEIADPSGSNPLFGPLGPVYDTMLALVPGSGEAAGFVGYEEVNGRPALRFSTGSFVLTNDTDQGTPVESMNVWIDEGGFLLRADVSTAARDDDGTLVLGYDIRYEVFDLGAAVTVTPPG